MFRDLLAAEWSRFGTLPDDQLAKLERHHNLLIRWNATLNLTRIRKLADVVRLHYCESLYLANALPAGELHIADVGSGAGFPGIPLAVARPECSVALIESHQRKAVFLTEAARDLPNVRVLATRAEALDTGFDWLTSRAVRPTQVLALSLAPRAALLMGADDLPRLPIPDRVHPLPWGDRRVLATFHVERDKI